MSAHRPAPSEPAPSRIQVLFLAANPAGTPALRLDEEIREISAKIRASEYRDSLELHSRWEVRPDDLQQALLEERPAIVHFSGHGSQDKEIVLEADDGTPKPVSTTALVSLFRTLRDNIRVVVLNACYSRTQAKAITQVIGCAVGMSKAVGDQAAIEFAASFHRALAFGRSIREAFDLGRTALLLEGIPEENTPQLLVRSGIDSASVVLIKAPQPGASTYVTVPTPQGTETQTEAVEKAVVVVDLSRYSDIARELEQHVGARAVRDLNAQIQGFITSALEAVGVTVHELPYKNTGDGAIIALDTAEQASGFAEALHQAAQAHNLKKEVPLAQRHFRVGIWTDTIILDRQTTAEGQFIGFEMAGTAIANAVRLEGACRTGEVLISPDTSIGGDSGAHGVQGETRCRPGNRAPLRRWLPALAAAALLWAGPGCGKNETNGFVPVAGRVMLDSKPLPVGSVSFRPDASKGNTSMHIPNGDINAEGNYELVTLGREGAPPGWYKVLVFADANTLATAGAPPVHPLPPKWMMNVKYTSEKTTNLSIKVVDKAAPGAYDLNVSK